MVLSLSPTNLAPSALPISGSCKFHSFSISFSQPVCRLPLHADGSTSYMGVEEPSLYECQSFWVFQSFWVLISGQGVGQPIAASFDRPKLGRF